MTKVPIHHLELSKLSPIFHLTPDPLFPTPLSIFNPISQISQLRRSRLFNQPTHFTFCNPLPIQFPYRFSPEQYKDLVDGDEIDVDKYLQALQPQFPSPPSPSLLSIYSSPNRFKFPFSPFQVLSISHNLAKDCLPNLDLHHPQTLNVLAGLETVANQHWAPFASCYAGHQFGSFAGQLGDGRAITILSTNPPNFISDRLKASFFDKIPCIELQLKGSGRTPYSRFADGLAVTRSSIREFLGSEALAALSIPTTRSISLIEFQSLQVSREKIEKASIVCRISPTWIRFGNFEFHKFKRDWKSLKILYQYVSKLYQDENWLPILYQRIGILIARWQAWGWMHGVLNTDNMSIFGLTIDLGPYAFMDIFDHQHICNHSDDMGRYRYSQQPSVALWNLKKLAESLFQVVGALKENRLDDDFGSKDIDEITWSRWTELGQKTLQDLEPILTDTFQKEYERVMFERLGIQNPSPQDFQEILSPFLDLLEDCALDYHSTFRILSNFNSTTSHTFQNFLSNLVPENRLDEYQKSEALKKWSIWLQKYEDRLKLDSNENVLERQQRMKSINPRFILRQWVLEEVIQRVDSGDKNILDQILKMCENPCKDYGELDPNQYNWSELSNKVSTETEEQRWCRYDGGGSLMLGYQCSCSS